MPNVKLLERRTYNLAFFFGPGLPLGFGNPSGPSATVALLFTAFFFGPSVGGGISVDGRASMATGVLAFGSDLLSPFELTAGIVLEFEDDGDSFGDSSLTTTGAGGWNFCKDLGDSLRVTIKLCLVDFLRGADVVVDLFVEAMMVVVLVLVRSCCCGRRDGVREGGKCFK